MLHLALNADVTVTGRRTFANLAEVEDPAENLVGIAQAATPLVFWWLEGATVYALGLIVIASIYIGFAVADGRLKVIAAESGVAFGFVVISAAAITVCPSPAICAEASTRCTLWG